MSDWEKSNCCCLIDGSGYSYDRSIQSDYELGQDSTANAFQRLEFGVAVDYCMLLFFDFLMVLLS
jgi:hypothetical protein